MFWSLLWVISIGTQRLRVRKMKSLRSERQLPIYSTNDDDYKTFYYELS